MIDHITAVYVAVARGRLPAVLAVRRPEDLRGRRRGRVDRQRAAAGGGVHVGVIVAMGGAQLRPEDYDPRLQRVRAVAGAARAAAGLLRAAPRAATRPTYVANFYRAFSAHHDCELVGPGAVRAHGGGPAVLRAGAGRDVGRRWQHRVAAGGLAGARARRRAARGVGGGRACCAA